MASAVLESLPTLFLFHSFARLQHFKKSFQTFDLMFDYLLVLLLACR